MKMLTAAFHRWWRQRALLGGHLTMSRDGQWGANHLTFQFIGDMIGPLVQRGYRHEPQLRKIVGSLHTTTIDELTSDLFLIERNIKILGYVDQRLVYASFMPRHLYTYLALSSGRALTPEEAWSTFNAMALTSTLPLTLMVSDDSYAQSDYYRLRYASVWEETFEVYRLFARLVGLDLPPLHH